MILTEANKKVALIISCHVGFQSTSLIVFTKETDYHRGTIDHSRRPLAFNRLPFEKPFGNPQIINFKS